MFDEKIQVKYGGSDGIMRISYEEESMDLLLQRMGKYLIWPESRRLE